MLDLDLATVAFQIANFLILAALLYYFLFRPTLRKMKEDAAAKELLAQHLSGMRWFAVCRHVDHDLLLPSTRTSDNL